MGTLLGCIDANEFGNIDGIKIGFDRGVIRGQYDDVELISFDST